MYWELFLIFVFIGSLSFGGGYAVLPLIEEHLVMNQGWISPQGFIDILTLSEMTPGPIAINSATFAGNRVAGILGGVIATFGVVLPSFIITLLLAYLYFKYQNLRIVKGVVEGLRPAVVALIASAGVTILSTALFDQSSEAFSLQSINWVNVLLFAAGIFVMRKFNFSPVQTIITTGIAGAIIFTII